MKKTTMWALSLIVITALASGCAQKSASEKLRDDLNQAGKEMDKEAKKFFN